MTRAIAVLAVSVALLAVTPAAVADELNQPTQGINSFDRNEAALFEGPHCHVVVPEQQDQFEFIAVYPSHGAHLAAGNDIFLPDIDCDGDPF